MQDTAMREHGPVRLSPPSPLASVVSTSLHSAQFSVLWSDGTVQSFQLHASGAQHLSLLPTFSQQISKLALTKALQNGKLHQSGHAFQRLGSTAALTTAGQGLVGIVGWSAVSNGDFGAQRLRVRVSDTQYGTTPVDAKLRLQGNDATVAAGIQVRLPATAALQSSAQLHASTSRRCVHN